MKELTIFVSLMFSVICYSNNMIEGRVIDNKKKPVFAANVYFKSSPEKGVTTNLNGEFKLEYTHDSDTLIVSFIGYVNKKIPANHLKKRTIIVLSEESFTLQEVIVTSSDPISEQFSVQKIDRMDIYLNPMAQADPLKAITILPVSTNTDETANPELRGSAKDRNRVIYNGVPIYNPVRASNLNNIGFFSLFNTEIIDKQYVYPSNPPLVFGNVTGGLVDIKTNTLLINNQKKVTVSLANIGFLISQKIKQNDTFFQLYGNFQFSELYKNIQKRKIPDIKKFGAKDMGMNLRLKITERLSINAFNYFLDEDYWGYLNMFTYEGQIDSKNKRFISVNNVNYYSKHGVLNANYGFSFSKKESTFGNSSTSEKLFFNYFSLNYKRQFNRKINLQTGISFDSQRNNSNHIIPRYYYSYYENSPTSKYDTLSLNRVLESYAYLNWQLNNKISMSSGLRKNIPILDQSNYLSFQYSSKYNIHEQHFLILGFGKYHNYTTPDYYNPKFQLLKGVQVSLDYNYEKKATKINSGFYIKKEVGEKKNEQYYTINKTKTCGMEFSIEQHFLDYFTITFSGSTIMQRVYVFEEKYKGPSNFSYFLKPSLTYQNPKLFTISLLYIGRPGNYILEYPIINGIYDKELGHYRPNYCTQLHQLKKTPYNRFDINISKYHPFKKCALTAYFTLNNIFNTKNPSNRVFYNYDYSKVYEKYYTFRTLFWGVIFTIY